MPQTEAQRKAKNKYNKKTYDQINYRVPTVKRIKELIAYASNIKGTSEAQYVLMAIETQLEKDNIKIEMLPVQETDQKTDI